MGFLSVSMGFLWDFYGSKMTRGSESGLLDRGHHFEALLTQQTSPCKPAQPAYAEGQKKRCRTYLGNWMGCISIPSSKMKPRNGNSPIARWFSHPKASVPGLDHRRVATFSAKSLLPGTKKSPRTLRGIRSLARPIIPTSFSSGPISVPGRHILCWKSTSIWRTTWMRRSSLRRVFLFAWGESVLEERRKSPENDHGKNMSFWIEGKTQQKPPFFSEDCKTLHLKRAHDWLTVQRILEVPDLGLSQLGMVYHDRAPLGPFGMVHVVFRIGSTIQTTRIQPILQVLDGKQTLGINQLGTYWAYLGFHVCCLFGPEGNPRSRFRYNRGWRPWFCRLCKLPCWPSFFYYFLFTPTERADLCSKSAANLKLFRSILLFCWLNHIKSAWRFLEI